GEERRSAERVSEIGARRGPGARRLTAKGPAHAREDALVQRGQGPRLHPHRRGRTAFRPRRRLCRGQTTAGPLRTARGQLRDHRNRRRPAGDERGSCRRGLPPARPHAGSRRCPTMSTAKRQQTMAKRNRERAVEEKRTLKRLKKQAAKAAKAAGEPLPEEQVATEFGEAEPDVG